MFKSNIPIYEQIKEIIKNNIVKGVWQEGERIPSVRAFATDLGVNPNTVMSALKDLQREDILENRRGMGNVVQPGVKERLAEEKKKDFINEKMIDLIKEAKMLGLKKEEFVDISEELWENQKNKN